MRYFLSYLALLPAAILCYLPVIRHVRVRTTLLILSGIPLFFFWAAIGGSLGTRFHVEFYQWLVPMLPLFALVFYFSTDLSIWKSISSFLAVGFWITNHLIRPRYYSTLYTNRVMQFYPILNLLLLGILLCFYLMFYLMARGLTKNMRLMQENEFLQLQSAQYRTLHRTIDETRMARHDLRHHFTVLSGYASNNDMEAIREYLSSWQTSLLPETVCSYCKNPAVNNVLGYFSRLAKDNGISIDISAKLQEPLIIPEPEFCVLLSNLLENAVEACQKQAGSNQIHVRLLQTCPSLLSLTVDNTCPEPPKWQNNSLHSSKHNGTGIGTRSVKNIAARYHGDARFEWKNGMFYVSVLLNPQGEDQFEA